MPNDGNKKTTSPPYIKNYGLFWQRKHVTWGNQGSAGSLFGKKKGSKKSNPINFREQIGFYALYDDKHELIYFGQVGKQTLFARLRQHTKGSISNRWVQFSWFGTRLVKKTDNNLSLPSASAQGNYADFLNQVEAIIIETARPKENRQGGKFKGADEYLQHKDK